jgi:hypothetical protein
MAVVQEFLTAFALETVDGGLVAGRLEVHSCAAVFDCGSLGPESFALGADTTAATSCVAERAEYQWRRSDRLILEWVLAQQNWRVDLVLRYFLLLLTVFIIVFLFFFCVLPEKYAHVRTAQRSTGAVPALEVELKGEVAGRRVVVDKRKVIGAIDDKWKFVDLGLALLEDDALIFDHSCHFGVNAVSKRLPQQLLHPVLDLLDFIDDA